MAAYLTIAALIPDRLPTQRAIELTRDEDEDTVNEDIVNAEIERAEAKVDGYVGAGWDLVAVHTEAPALLAALTGDLAIAALYRRRPGAIPEEVEKAETLAIAQLRDISRGIISLGIQPHPGGDPQRLVRTGGAARRFTRTTLGVM